MDRQKINRALMRKRYVVIKLKEVSDGVYSPTYLTKSKDFTNVLDDAEKFDDLPTALTEISDIPHDDLFIDVVYTVEPTLKVTK